MHFVQNIEYLNKQYVGLNIVEQNVPTVSPALRTCHVLIRCLLCNKTVDIIGGSAHLSAHEHREGKGLSSAATKRGRRKEKVRVRIQDFVMWTTHRRGGGDLLGLRDVRLPSARRRAAGGDGNRRRIFFPTLAT